MTYSLKQIIGSLALASFVLVALFSSAIMMYGPDGKMLENCPFSAMGVSLCSQDGLAMVFHHISAYQSFLGASTNYGLLASIASLLFVVGAAFFLLIGLPPLDKLMTQGGLPNAPPLVPPNRQITRWLSLFENSPSLL